MRTTVGPQWKTKRKMIIRNTYKVENGIRIRTIIIQSDDEYNVIQINIHTNTCNCTYIHTYIHKSTTTNIKAYGKI